MEKSIRILFFIIIIMLLSACAVKNLKLFSQISEAEDKTYGYTEENPVTIKNSNLEKSVESSYYYLSRLRTEKGNKLRLIQRYSVANPNYEKPLLPVVFRYTGEPLSYGNGPLLDLYILKPENETDTLRIYINPYLKGEIKTPYGLKFQNE